MVLWRCRDSDARSNLAYLILGLILLIPIDGYMEGGNLGITNEDTLGGEITEATHR